MVLSKARDFVSSKHLCSGTGRMCAQNRFQPRLGDEQSAAWADGLNTFVEARNDVCQLAARKMIHRNNRSFGQEVIFRALSDLVLNTGGAEDLQRTQMKMGCTGKGRNTVQALNRERFNPSLPEKQCQARSDKPTSGDDYRILVLHFRFHAAPGSRNKVFKRCAR